MRTGTPKIRTDEGAGSQADILAHLLQAESAEFAELWADHDVDVPYNDDKRIIHPEVGTISMHCQTLMDPDQAQLLLVLTAAPGTQDDDRLRLLSIIAGQQAADREWRSVPTNQRP